MAQATELVNDTGYRPRNNDSIRFEIHKPFGTEETLVVTESDYSELLKKYDDLKQAMQLLAVMFVIAILYGAAMTFGYQEKVTEVNKLNKEKYEQQKGK